jgi:hypothetical protein
MNRPQVAYFLSGVLAYFPSGAHRKRRSGSNVARRAKALTKASCASSSATARSLTRRVATFTAAEAYLPTRALKAAWDPASA